MAVRPGAAATAPLAASRACSCRSSSGSERWFSPALAHAVLMCQQLRTQSRRLLLIVTVIKHSCAAIGHPAMLAPMARLFNSHSDCILPAAQAAHT